MRARVATAVAAAILLPAGGCVDLGDDGTIGFGVDVPEGWGDYEPDWSPSGSELAVSSTRPDGGIAFDIHLLDLQGNWVRLTQGVGGGSPSWSPDGSLLAFSNGSFGIQVVDRAGSQVRELPTGRQVLGPVAWAPNGRDIAFTTGGGAVESHIWVLDTVGAAVTRLTTPGAHHLHLSWSPDGSQAVYSRFAASSGANGIYRIEADGSDPTLLLQAEGALRTLADPAWSPCGTHIAFAGTNGGKTAIQTMKSDGSEVTVLTDALGDDRDPTWSPDCSRIAFSSDRAGALPDVWSVAVDGSGLRMITRRE